MPTVGWIFEGAAERFWEGQPEAPPVPPPVFVCNRCGKELQSPQELNHHLSLEHPLELPALYVRGEPLLRESVLRSPVTKNDVELMQCTRCEVQMDGRRWQKMTVQEFRAEFSRPAEATWNVRLLHERALDKSRTEEEYHVRFRIPNTASLNAVDEQFVQTLVIQQLSHTDLERFEAALPAEAPPREYGGALGDYALGIILKERRIPPHAPVAFEEFAVKMRLALEILRLFNRPVALAVSASIRFNLNDFHGYGPTNATEIETGLHFFSTIMGGAEGGKSVGATHRVRKAHSKPAVCPVDQATHCLLSACSSLNDGGKLDLSELEALRQLTRGMLPISEQDLAKIHVICAEGYLRLARAPDALPHLRAVQFDPTFKEWAKRRLNSIS